MADTTFLWPPLKVFQSARQRHSWPVFAGSARRHLTRWRVSRAVFALRVKTTTIELLELIPNSEESDGIAVG